VLSLGETPLANSLLTPEQLGGEERRYPLDLVFCRACSLVQITATVPPEQLFREYLYFSSFSDTMLRHAQDIAAGLIESQHLAADSLVVEIASNDGYLLKNFVAAGIPVLGIEPARNIAEVAEGRGIPTLCEFFSAALAAGLVAAGRTADVIIANNVMAHVPDINGFVAGVATLLKPGGVFVVETPYIADLVERLEIDTIYHEHLFYYSATAFDQLLRRNGLAIANVERIALHGGSLRITAVHAAEAEARAAGTEALLEHERTSGMTAVSFYDGFAERVDALRLDLRALLGGLKARGFRIAAYGASAKGSTLLNAFAIGGETLDFVVDRSSFKQGRYTPGSRLLISPPERLLDEQPDYTLLLTWNFADEILAQQREYQARGGRFIKPLPSPRIVTPSTEPVQHT
jgi:SAM-dependent methyltransferase